MAIDETIFPKGCTLGLNTDRTMTPLGKIIFEATYFNEMNGNGAEQPCYGCRKDECKERGIEYHDDEKRFIIKPTHAPPFMMAPIRGHSYR